MSWKFPITGGGSESGHKHSGISHFTGARIPSLAREIIQNSLDARASIDKAVTVEFKDKKIPIGNFPSHLGLLDIFRKCVKRCKTEKADDKVLKFYENGVKILGRDNIRFLQISDYNTTGLTDDPDLFHKLIKAQEDSNKDSQAGGSYGIGKFAPYAVSDLRTVFYSTMYIKGNTEIHKAQGRAVLMTHINNSGEKTQGTGFYGDNTKTECNPIPPEDIPDFLSRDTTGTTVSIAEFSASSGWDSRITESVVANFFVAIQEGKLEVSVGDKPPINRGSLQQYFNELCPEGQGVAAHGDYSDIGIARHMHDALQHGKEIEFQLTSGLGHCKLWILQGEGLPKVVGMVRSTGMLISTKLRKLIKFPGIGDFIAICICQSAEGNALLRAMENPQHNAFEPDRLEGLDITKGEKALDELAKKVRAKIKEIVSPDQGSSVRIREMTKFFPDTDDNSGDEGDAERDFERGLEITKKPPKPQKPVPIETESQEGDDGDEDGDEIEGGGGKSGSGTGSGSGGGDGDKNSIAIQNIRVVKTPNKTGVYEVFFTPKESGKVNLLFRIAGDQKVDNLPLLPECLNRAKGITVEKGKRTSFVIESPQDINGAIRVDAHGSSAPKSSSNSGE